jgi:chromosome segregation ATPase
VQHRLQSDFQSLAAENSRLTQEAEEFRESSTNLEIKLEAVQRDVVQARQDGASAKQELNRLKMELSRCKHDLEEKTNSNAALQEQLYSINAEKESRTGADASRLRELEAEKRRLEERMTLSVRDAEDKAVLLNRVQEEKNSLDRKCAQVRWLLRNLLMI